MKRSLTVPACLLLLSPFIQATELTPGRWTLSMEMEAPGIPENMRTRVQQDCMSADDASDLEASMKNKWKEDNCGNTKLKRNGDTLTWSADCTMPGTSAQTRVSGKMVVHDRKHYTSEMTMKGNNQQMKTRIEGEWAGECEN